MGWLSRLRASWGPGRGVRLNLALQGGGSHGAFTWGVLDRLLEEGRIGYEGLSGTSAGALNAAAFASGLLAGGRDEARASLERLWRTVSEQALGGPLQATPLDYLLLGWNRDWSPGFVLVNSLSRMASPYQLNPGGYNPLVRILEETVDFERLRQDRRVRMFVAATRVRTGEARIFRNGELDARAVAASACLPLLFQAVEIDGEAYWDGGYTANPALWPLFLECRSRDLLLVQLTPPERPELPTRVADIVDRANEIAFNANLVRELELLGLLRGGRAAVSPALPWRRHRLHAIDTGTVTEGMGRNSRINPDWHFLCHLRDEGRARADAWLQAHGAALGRHSSMA
ncbi:patatin-like phospholipase family protein [Aquisalimonas lutea]|uniref:patatin-like phospholipase family protein n=1 Tax=Aquisalimonas lutea TaxID=1327750 RepID=UPI0025B4641B|nr:patatin-like phospholipase family protein [Aquisalimonas lutea]MDN3517090.1 patatin-like phospholipase family protein [Aquisalimonas lutea]